MGLFSLSPLHFWRAANRFAVGPAPGSREDSVSSLVAVRRVRPEAVREVLAVLVFTLPLLFHSPSLKITSAFCSSLVISNMMRHATSPSCPLLAVAGPSPSSHPLPLSPLPSVPSALFHFPYTSLFTPISLPSIACALFPKNGGVGINSSQNGTFRLLSERNSGSLIHGSWVSRLPGLRMASGRSTLACSDAIVVTRLPAAGGPACGRGPVISRYFTQALSFHILTHSFARLKMSTPLFSSIPALFAQNMGVGEGGTLLRIRSRDADPEKCNTEGPLKFCLAGFVFPVSPAPCYISSLLAAYPPGGLVHA